MRDENENTKLSRRALLCGAAAGLAVLSLPRVSRAAPAPARTLSFVHTHTGERGRITYWADGDYLPEGLAEAQRILRDHYSGDVHPIEPRLLDLLHALHGELAASEPFHVISGYRSSHTNAALAARGGGVASKSLHMTGAAIDVRLPGRALAVVRDAALGLRSGGVGFYPGPDFVHVDVGRVRRW